MKREDLESFIMSLEGARHCSKFHQLDPLPSILFTRILFTLVSLFVNGDGIRFHILELWVSQVYKKSNVLIRFKENFANSILCLRLIYIFI